MLKSKLFFVLFFPVFTIWSSCTSNEIGNSRDVTQDKIYQSYSIDYTEGDPVAKVFCQFRFAGSNGTTLILSQPSQVQFDAELIKADSSDYSGAYYKLNKSIDGFWGNHSFTFTDTHNKTFTNRFSFDECKLVNIPATASKAKDLMLPFKTPALQIDEYINVAAVNSDSTFSISHSYKDGNSIIIPAEYLKKQKGTTLILEASIFRKPALQQTTTESGVMVIKYRLRPVKITLTE